MARRAFPPRRFVVKPLPEVLREFLPPRKSGSFAGTARRDRKAGRYRGRNEECLQ
jgi:hypothetical protein